MSLSALTNFLTTHGWIGFVFAAVVFVLYRYSSVVIDQWQSRKNRSKETKDKIDQIELLNHRFFTDASFKINVEIPTMSLSGVSEIRQKLFKMMLLIKIKEIHNGCLDIARSEMCKMTPAEWAALIYNSLDNMMKRFEEECRKEEIPEIIIKKFSMWHYETLKVIYSHVSNLAASSLYTNNLARTNTFLLVMNVLLETTIGDAERSLVELNGELSNLLYKGEQIG